MEIREINSTELSFLNLAKEASIFSSPDWIKIYGNKLKLIGIFNNDSKLIGSFFYYVENKFGLKRLRVPPYSPHCGFFYINPSKNRSSINGFHKEVMESLVNFLDSRQKSLLTLAFPSNVVDLQNFTWEGYKVIPNYTYQIDLKQPAEDIFKEFDSKNRNLITKTEKENYEISTATDKNTLLTFFSQSLQNAEANVYPQILSSLINEFVSGDNSFSFILKDSSGNFASAVLCLYDKNTCYYLLAGNNRKHVINGANNLLLYMSILKAKELGCKLFDFEGSMIPGVEKFFRSFGGNIVPYFTVNKGGFLIETALKLKLPSSF